MVANKLVASSAAKSVYVDYLRNICLRYLAPLFTVPPTQVLDETSTKTSSNQAIPLEPSPPPSQKFDVWKFVDRNRHLKNDFLGVNLHEDWTESAKLYVKLSPNAGQDSAELHLSHVDQKTGKAQMVNVGRKPSTSRLAEAEAVVKLNEETFGLLARNKMQKGDVLTVAQISGIMAAKRTPDLVPLCHVIPLDVVSVNFTLDHERHLVNVTSRVECQAKTGAEMEALMAVTVASLTIYDMCKAVSSDILIGEIKLSRKTGGKTDYELKKEKFVGAEYEPSYMD